ncbi:MAG: undecaprenyl/decaprenyl-phosphate alpha-N-acetylglucosaminyl 1-phosphate transferase [Ardenticatenaceae bacterium]|nr:undecaprenyl/decaprenyl-phosphate alpha-N-acetylglucosaminyl 1-phosphate transferase [Ardenticatenaceae bacterium]
MHIVIAIFLMALSVTALSIPWVRRLAIRTGFVDAPASRKMHSTPMPLMGGVAIFGGAVLAVITFFPDFPNTVAGTLLSLAVVTLVGLLDDRFGLPAWVKLGGQFVGFLILAFFDIRVKLPLPEVVNYAITFVWLAGISNAINFLDNMDGLSAGVSGVAAAFITLLGLQNDQFLVSGLAAAVLGACLGFLRFNFKPAQIFMGDAGALFLGFLLALLGLQLRFPANSNFVTWMVPIFILGLPIFDTTLVVVSRIRRGVSPNTPGKDHLSHRLVQRGFSQREAVLMLYLLTGAGGMIAVFITQATVLEGYLIFATLLLLGGVAIWQLDQPV